LSVVYPFWVVLALGLEGFRYRTATLILVVVTLLAWQTHMNWRWVQHLWVN
jgi:hypothetical protein